MKRTQKTAAVACAAAVLSALTAGPAVAAKPSPPPTSSSAPIAYFSYSIRPGGGETNSQEDIFTVDPTKGSITRLTDDRRGQFVSDRDPAWSPDRTKLAIYRDNGSGSHIAVLDAKSGKTLKEFPTAVGIQPDWLNNNQIVYSGGPFEQMDLFVLDYTSGAIRPLTAALPGETFGQPAWLPSKGLAVSLVRSEWYTPPTEDGGESYWNPVSQDVVTFTAADVSNALASPEGRITATQSTDVTASRGLAWSDNPSWSPDGNRIVFSNGGDIVLVNLALPGYVQITGDAPEVLDGSDNSPVFSPDGTKLAWARGNEDEWSEIVVENVADAGKPNAWTVVGNERQVRFKGGLDW